MNGNEDERDEDIRAFRRSIAASCLRLRERAVILDSLTEETFVEIGDGIVFIQAPWAMQSVIALRAISGMLCEMDFAEIRLWIVEIASVDLHRDIFGKISLGGYGETFWIRDSLVRKVGSNYSDMDLVEIRAITQKVFHET